MDATELFGGVRVVPVVVAVLHLAMPTAASPSRASRQSASPC
jgi:hypothetical protein